MLHPSLRRLLAVCLLVLVLPSPHWLGHTVTAQEPPAATEEPLRVDAQPPGDDAASATTGEGPAAVAAPTPAKDSFFGIVQAIHDPEMAVAAGATWERLVVWWSAFQPNGPDEWVEGAWPQRPAIEEQRARGIEAVGVVLHTPPWAAREDGDPAVSPPHNLELPFDDPQNYWGQFMMRLAREYAGAIDTWIVWNEPEFCWTGTVAEFAQLQKVAYQAIKAANPDATVILTGTTYWMDHERGRTLFLERLLDRLAKEAGFEPPAEGSEVEGGGAELRVPGSGPEEGAGEGDADGSQVTGSDGIQGTAEGGEATVAAAADQGPTRPSSPERVGQAEEDDGSRAAGDGTQGTAEDDASSDVTDACTLQPESCYSPYYFDAVAVHQYGSPLNSYTVPVLYRRILASYGIDVPIWFPEANVVPHDDPLKTLTRGGLRATMEEQASYMIQSTALARAAGVERYSVYKMRDEAPENDQYYGLVRNDGSPRPAYYAYQVAIREMSGVTDAQYFWSGSASPPTEDEITALLASTSSRTQFVWPGAMNGVRMRRGDDRVTVLWNASAAPLAIGVPSSAPSAMLIDKYGEALPLERDEDGAFRLTLAPATNNTDARDPSLVLVGGDPVILVEPGVAATRDPFPRPIDACWGVPGSLVLAGGVVSGQSSVVGGGASVDSEPPSASGQDAVETTSELGAYPAPGEGGGRTQTTADADAQALMPVRPPDGTEGTSEQGEADSVDGHEGPAVQAPPYDDGMEVWVAPTGYAVSGPWLDYFRASGEVEAWGYPRSPVVADPLDDTRCVQHFQRGVFEWHADEPDPKYRIQRRLLGALLGDAAAPVPPSAEDGPDYRYFPFGDRGLGHAVSNVAPDGTRIGFKEFYDRHGGENTFGYPMEPPMQRRGPDGVMRWTQRFQAALFEYHAEFDTDDVQPETGIPWRTWRVQLALLGDAYLRDAGLPFVSGDPAKHISRPPEPTP